jgi:hypothetical protein
MRLGTKDRRVADRRGGRADRRGGRANRRGAQVRRMSILMTGSQETWIPAIHVSLPTTGCVMSLNGVPQELTQQTVNKHKYVMLFGQLPYLPCQKRVVRGAITGGVRSPTTVILVLIRETAVIARPTTRVLRAVFAILSGDMMATANRVLLALTALNAIFQKPALWNALRRAEGRLQEVQVRVRWPQEKRETMNVGKPRTIIVVSLISVPEVLTRQTAATEIQERLSNSSQTQIEIMMVASTRTTIFRLRSQSEEGALFSDFGHW